MSPPLWVHAEPLDSVVLLLYYSLLGVLSLYGLHRLWLLSARPQASRACACPGCAAGSPLHRETAGSAGSLGPPIGGLPRVTVQLPLYNEPRVVARLIAATSRLDYPCDRLEIQVLDDSTDGSSEEVAAAVSRARRAGLRIEHLRRRHREGYKAGALAEGLRRASGELVAIFDADFVPPSDFLRRCIGHFRDPDVGMVQARWSHLNRRRSLLTRLQAIFLDGHFLVEHQARYGRGCLFNFNGTAGVWRRQAIETAGGWQHDTLTEDLDLSYRSQLAGWKFVFAPEVEVPAELPATASAFRTQQRRWTHGSTQTLRKLWRPLLLAALPTRVKLEAFVHLASNLAYPLLVGLALLMPWASLARHRLGQEPLVALDVGLLLLASGCLAAFYAVAQRRAGRSAIAALALHPAVIALGVGMSVHNAAAALAGLWVRGGEFERTPKSGEQDAALLTSSGAVASLASRRTEPEVAAEAAAERAALEGAGSQGGGQVLHPRIAGWSSSRAESALARTAVRLPRLDVGWWMTTLMGFYLIWGAWLSASLGAWWFVPFEALFAAGYLAVSVLQVDLPTSRARQPMARSARHERRRAWHARRFEVKRVDDSVA